MEDQVAPVAIFKKRGAKGKANLRKRPATPSADDDSDYSSSEDESGQRVKRRKRTAVVAASSKDNNSTVTTDIGATVFSADRSIPITDSNDATKASNWYDEDDGNKKKTVQKDDDTIPDGNYYGLANMASYIQKNPDRQNKTVGPVKAPTNIRTITIMDYRPDVCKDYKQTGFCGFGDNCIYLHDRSDYKQGWQLDREWETVTKGKKNLGGTVVASADRSKKTDADDDDDDAMLDNIPFVCIICREDYKNPIVTRCGHYFCEKCALQRYRKDPGCAACGSGTSGVFNNAKKLKKLLERKKLREEQREKEEEEEEEEE